MSMMLCDRCGQRVKQRHASWVINQWVYARHPSFPKELKSKSPIMKVYALCPDCEASLIAWFERGGMPYQTDRC